MHYHLSYKRYRGSTRATALSILGGLLKLISAVLFVSLISTIYKHKSVDQKTTMIFITLGITFLILGLLISKLADKIGESDFERKIKEDLDFAICMSKENPDSKGLYMQINPKFAQYVLAREEEILTEPSPDDFVPITPRNTNRFVRIAAAILIIVTIIPLFIFLNDEDSSDTNNSEKNSISNVFSDHSTSSGDEKKYSTYVKLNNDTLWRYDASVTPYTEQFGTKDTITMPKRDISGITPVLDTFYSELDKMKKKAQENPKTDVDESAVKLIDETKKMYDVVNEVAGYYNDGKYKNDNLARAQELHTKYIKEIDVWYNDYLDFSAKLDPMAVRIMSKDLDKFKKNGQDYEYYSLKLLVDAEAITTYMSDNQINDGNVLSSDLTEYKKLLATLDETYEQYKKYSQNKSGSIHLESLKKECANFVSSSERIVKVVDAQDYNAGMVYEKGIVYASGGEKTPVSDLGFYLDRMISDYNSSLSFDKN